MIPHGVVIIALMFVYLLYNKRALHPLIAWMSPLVSHIRTFVAQPFAFADALNYGFE